MTIITPRSFAGLAIEQPQQKTRHFNMLVYGRSSVGKTTLVASADAVPEMRRVLFVDAEGGTLSLTKTPYEVDELRIKEWDDVAKVYEELAAGNHDYQTVIFDSLTELQDMNMKQLMREMSSDPNNMERDPDIPTWTEWNKTGKHIRALVTACKRLSMNVIFTALVKEDKDPKTGITMRLPDLPGKMASRVAAWFDIVLYYTIVDGEDGQQRIVASQAGTNTVAKNRGSDKLPGILPIPNPEDRAAMSLLYPMILGKA